MSSESKGVTEARGGPIRRFGVPINMAGCLQNLGNHLLLIAQPTDSGYAMRSVHPPRDVAEWRRRRDEHLRGVADLIHLLDRRAKPKVETPRGRALTLQLFSELWADVVVGGSGNPDQVDRAIHRAEDLLCRCTPATACYVGEVISVMPRPEDALGLLRRTAPHAMGEIDREFLGYALRHALEFVGRAVQPANAVGPATDAANVPRNANTGAGSTLAVPPQRPARKLHLTANQQAALERVEKMGELFFAREQSEYIQPKLSPLLAGPTGVGKSFLCDEAARRLGASYYRITRGDWTIQHARYGIPTIYQIADLAAVHDRVLVHIDELDKFQGLFGGAEWTASLAADLWNALDKRFPMADFFACDAPEVAKMAARRLAPTELQTRIDQNVFFVGSGTWQDVFASAREIQPIGFAQRRTSSVSADAIVDAKVIPQELLSRFNSELIILRYPEPHEIDGLLDAFGIRSLARDVGIEVNAASVDFANGGMRVLETLQTRLLLERQKRKSQ